MADDVPLNPQGRLGYVPMGTGGDFQRTLQAPTDPELAAVYLAEGRATPIDIGSTISAVRSG